MRWLLIAALICACSVASGGEWVKQSTAVILKLGPFLDDTDFTSVEPGLTIAQGDLMISKVGGAFAQTSEASPTTTYDADGWYPIPLTATDTGTLGRIAVQITMSGALQVWWEGMVVPANVWDSMFGADTLQVHTVETALNDYDGSDTSGTTTLLGLITAARMGALDDWIDAGRLDAILDLVLADTGELQADWVDAGRLDAILDLVLADTGELQTDWLNGGRLDLLLDAVSTYDGSDTSGTTTLLGLITAARMGALDDWINAGRLDAILDLILADSGELQTRLANMIEADVGDWRFTTNSLEQGPSGGGGGDATEAKQDTIITDIAALNDPTAAANAAEVETVLTAAHGAGAWSSSGGGAITFVYTLTAGGDPIDDALVEVCTDAAMTNVTASGRTNAAGTITFFLDAGTYYLKRSKGGYTFTNPDTEVVS